MAPVSMTVMLQNRAAPLERYPHFGITENPIVHLHFKATQSDCVLTYSLFVLADHDASDADTMINFLKLMVIFSAA